MKRIVLSVLSVALVGLVAAPALAETRVHEGAQVEIWIPDGWDAEFDGDVMTITDDEDEPEVAIIFAVLKCSELGDAIDLLADAVGDAVDNLAVDDEAEELEINGLDALSLEADGEIDGAEVELGFLIVKTPNGKILMGVGIGSSDHLHKHEKNITKILRSIAPAGDDMDD